MNNLKFRAWDKTAKKMSKVTAIDFSTEPFRVFYKAYGNENYFNKDVILMQSTGLFDKYGVEIYEGDIIDVGTRIPFLNKIQRDEETAYLKLVPLDKRWTESYFTNFEDKSRYEVVGNIYENKELI